MENYLITFPRLTGSNNCFTSPMEHCLYCETSLKREELIAEPPWKQKWAKRVNLQVSLKGHHKLNFLQCQKNNQRMHKQKVHPTKVCTVHPRLCFRLSPVTIYITSFLTRPHWPISKQRDDAFPLRSSVHPSTNLQPNVCMTSAFQCTTVCSLGV